MNGGPPHWIPTETGPRLGDPLFLSKTRARGVAEGRAGARAGGWERPSSGVQIIFTSATSGWTLTGREARRASRCPGQVRDRGSVGRALPKPGASACAWTSRPPPGASVLRLQALPLGVPRPRTAARRAPSRPSQCPQSCVRLHEAPLHAPARAQPCEVRAEVRADCPGLGGVGHRSPAALLPGRPCRLSGLTPSAVNGGSCCDSLCSGGPSTCTVGPGGPCSCRSVPSRADLPQGTAGLRGLHFANAPHGVCCRAGVTVEADRRMDGQVGAQVHGKIEALTGWITGLGNSAEPSRWPRPCSPLGPADLIAAA